MIYSSGASALKRGDLEGLFGGAIPAGFDPEAFTTRDLVAALPKHPPENCVVHLENVLKHFSIDRADLAPLLSAGNRRLWEETFRHLAQ